MTPDSVDSDPPLPVPAGPAWWTRPWAWSLPAFALAAATLMKSPMWQVVPMPVKWGYRPGVPAHGFLLAVIGIGVMYLALCVNSVFDVCVSMTRVGDSEGYVAMMFLRLFLLVALYAIVLGTAGRYG